MGFWNTLSKVGYKAWSSIKQGVSDIYAPIKKIVSTVHKGSQFVDGLLDSASRFGVPSSLIDLIRDNPIYSTIRDSIEFVDDLVEKDIPEAGRVIENFVEHGVFQNHVPRSGGDSNPVNRSIPGFVPVNRNAFGFTPNNQPSSRQFMGAGSSVS